MIILGIDPGIAIVGYGVLKKVGNKLLHLEHGIISTPAKTPQEERLLKISIQLNELLDDHTPDAVAIEELFFGVNTKTAMAVSEARGVLLLEMTKRKIPIYSYKPVEIKVAVSGYGHAKKPQVMAMVKSLLNLEKIPKPDDAADGLAIAICHCNSVRIKSLQ